MSFTSFTRAFRLPETHHNQSNVFDTQSWQMTQCSLWSNMHTVTIAPRRGGLTTLINLFTLFEAIDKPNQRIASIARRPSENVRTLRNLFAAAYPNGVVNDHGVSVSLLTVKQNEIHFSNGSMIRFVAESEIPDRGRGSHFDRVWVDHYTDIDYNQLRSSLKQEAKIAVVGQEGLLPAYMQISTTGPTIYQVLPYEQLFTDEQKDRLADDNRPMGYDRFETSYRPSPYFNGPVAKEDFRDSFKPKERPFSELSHREKLDLIFGTQDDWIRAAAEGMSVPRGNPHDFASLYNIGRVVHPGRGRGTIIGPDGE